VEEIPLSEFISVESLLGRLDGRQWPSEIPTSAVGGIVNHRFPLPKVYQIVLAVSGRTTRNAANEILRVETTIKVARRPTLQVTSSQY